jgi:hypothetical protein
MYNAHQSVTQINIQNLSGTKIGLSFLMAHNAKIRARSPSNCFYPVRARNALPFFTEDCWILKPTGGSAALTCWPHNPSQLILSWIITYKEINFSGTLSFR